MRALSTVRQVPDTRLNQTVIVAHRNDLSKLALASYGEVQVPCADYLATPIDGLPPSLARKTHRLPSNNPWKNLDRGKVLIFLPDLQAFEALLSQLKKAGAKATPTIAVTNSKSAISGHNAGGDGASSGPPPLPPPETPLFGERKLDEDCDEKKQCCLEPEVCSDLKGHTVTITLSCGPLEVEICHQPRCECQENPTGSVDPGCNPNQSRLQSGDQRCSDM